MMKNILAILFFSILNGSIINVDQICVIKKTIDGSVITFSRPPSNYDGCVRIFDMNSKLTPVEVWNLLVKNQIKGT